MDKKIRKEGFTVLSDPEGAIADIVLIHGLQGDPYKTWLHEKKPLVARLGLSDAGVEKCYWPHDLLSGDFPKCRILTYGYDSYVSHFFSGSANQTNILGHATTFISLADDIRLDDTARPIIFIAHSLGGLLVKAILREAATKNHEIYDATVGTIFLGTPHRGSSGYPELGRLVSVAARAIQFDTSEAILRDFHVDATILQVLTESFKHAHRNLGFYLVTFEEGRGLGKPIIGRDKVVPSWSAHLDFDDELKDVINADHRKMCRFSSQDHSGYVRIRVALRKCIALKILGVRAQARDEMFRKALDALGTPETSWRFQNVEEAYEGTYEWIFTNEALGFRNWLMTDEPLFWIQGQPASGKSTLMKKILYDTRTKQMTAIDGYETSQAAFFFHDRGSNLQKTFHGLMLQILHSLAEDLPQLEPVFYDVFKKYKRLVTAASIFEWTQEICLETFDAILTQVNHPVSILLLLDALDEYSGPKRDIVNFLYKRQCNSKTRLKICFSSRPEQVFINAFSDLPGFAIQHHTAPDIEKVIRGEFLNDKPMRQAQLTSAHEVETLITEIQQRANGVFLWVRLVIDDLLKAYGERGQSLKQLQSYLDDLPPTLDGYYQHTIETRIDSRDQDDCARAFQILKWAEAPLTLLEFWVALHVEEEDFHSEREIMSVYVSRASVRLRALSGGLIELLDPREAVASALFPSLDFRPHSEITVQFLHQTVKTFVTGAEGRILAWTGHLDRGPYFISMMFAFLIDRNHPVISSEVLSVSGRYVRAAENVSKADMTVCLRHASPIMVEVGEYGPRLFNYERVELAIIWSAQQLLKRLITDQDDVRGRKELGRFMLASYFSSVVTYSWLAKLPERASTFALITTFLFKMGIDEVLRTSSRFLSEKELPEWAETALLEDLQSVLSERPASLGRITLDPEWDRELRLRISLGLDFSNITLLHVAAGQGSGTRPGHHLGLDLVQLLGPHVSDWNVCLEIEGVTSPLDIAYSVLRKDLLQHLRDPESNKEIMIANYQRCILLIAYGAKVTSYTSSISAREESLLTPILPSPLDRGFLHPPRRGPMPKSLGWLPWRYLSR